MPVFPKRPKRAPNECGCGDGGPDFCWRSLLRWARIPQEQGHGGSDETLVSQSSMPGDPRRARCSPRPRAAAPRHSPWIAMGDSSSSSQLSAAVAPFAGYFFDPALHPSVPNQNVSANPEYLWNIADAIPQEPTYESSTLETQQYYQNDATTNYTQASTSASQNFTNQARPYASTSSAPDYRGDGHSPADAQNPSMTAHFPQYPPALASPHVLSVQSQPYQSQPALATRPEENLHMPSSGPSLARPSYYAPISPTSAQHTHDQGYLPQAQQHLPHNVSFHGQMLDEDPLPGSIASLEDRLQDMQVQKAGLEKTISHLTNYTRSDASQGDYESRVTLSKYRVAYDALIDVENSIRNKLQLMRRQNLVQTLPTNTHMPYYGIYNAAQRAQEYATYHVPSHPALQQGQQHEAPSPPTQSYSQGPGREQEHEWNHRPFSSLHAPPQPRMLAQLQSYHRPYPSQPHASGSHQAVLTTPTDTLIPSQRRFWYHYQAWMKSTGILSDLDNVSVNLWRLFVEVLRLGGYEKVGIESSALPRAIR
ncbi:hypothetical protein BOTBODRAFT_44712 [Botryobasidium botryosum FD-172 SS1]|uniref:Uncharacterized protein n=1 Tax=Botryobasidium botryosum (strain FD-172 SS1) TaxID=930990 RepID=A0A067MF20_BOTB1|nr:hypothetical protein BOTBODRAFT_44712 [Botryobasidium botryosum FD-172 SS1]